jgi:hypothetical protein
MLQYNLLERGIFICGYGGSKFAIANFGSFEGEAPPGADEASPIR